MRKNLEKALPLLLRARVHIKDALTRKHWPVMHEDIDYLIKETKDIIAALDRGETLPS